jgi:hypothetical protein
MAAPLPGHMLRVLKYRFRPDKEEPEEKSSLKVSIGTLQVVDGVSPDAMLVAAIALSTPCPGNEVRELDVAATRVIAKMAADRYPDRAFVVCVTLTNAPFINVGVDFGSFHDRDDQFDKDVAAAIAVKTATRIPLIYINANIRHRILMHVDLSAPEPAGQD